MKYIIAFLISSNSICAFSQKGIELNNTGQLKVLDHVTAERLNQDPFNSWFQPNYDTFEIAREHLYEIQQQLSNMDSIQIFFGSWCGDSKREVPRMLKILNESEFEKYSLIGLDNSFQNYKQSPFGEEIGKNIHRVPTVIFYKDSTEINRIVESPKVSLTEDLLALLQHNYNQIIR